LEYVTPPSGFGNVVITTGADVNITAIAVGDDYSVRTCQ